MAQMLGLAICLYFSHTDVAQIFAGVYASNTPPMRVLEKTGFRKCGVHRKDSLKNGMFGDFDYFELLKGNCREPAIL